MTRSLNLQINSMAYECRTRPVICDISLEIPQGKVFSILGPTGAGKSTLLRIIAGLEVNFSGSITLDGDRVLAPSRDIQLVFQDYCLLPWKTVRDNLRFAANHSLSTEKTERQVEAMLEKANIKELAERWPREISGGQKASVALARAFMDPPKILLLDEPFRGLDLVRRVGVEKRLIVAARQRETTVILVTHSVEDAVFLSDSVILVKADPMKIFYRHDLEVDRDGRDRLDPRLQKVSAELTERLLSQNNERDAIVA
jgi:sulfonate transport system ATP-binding protein